MTSRQRLLSALEGKPTDRVPISTYELCAYYQGSFENNEPSYANLMAYIAAHTDCVMMWNPGSDEQSALSSYCLETSDEIWREGEKEVTKTVLHTPSGDLSRTTKREKNIKTTWQTEHLCKCSADVNAWLSIPFEPVSYDFASFPCVNATLGDRGIVMSSLADPVCRAMDLMELGEATVWALTEPEHFARTLGEIHRRGMVNLKRMLECQVVDLYRICGPEYLTPPFLPPVYFEKYVLPYLADMVALIHRHGAKARVHCHGRIGQVLGMILASGGDALDPCEAPPDGDITLADIKKRAGDTMCLFGNLQMKLLEHADAREVAAEVALCMRSAKEGGRYVIMPTAAPINIPLSKRTEENYKVFIDDALRLGAY